MQADEDKSLFALALDVEDVPRSGSRNHDALFGVCSYDFHGWKLPTCDPTSQHSLRDLPVGDFSLVREYRCAVEGGGVAWDGARLVRCDGRHDVRVVGALDELEFVDGSVYANIRQSDRVARIAPDSGAVTGWLDLSSIAERERRAGEVDVADGIAWDGRTLYVTGKLWRSVYGRALLR